MKQRAISRTVMLALIIVLMTLTHVSAGSAKRGIQGDWQVKIDYNGREVSSILSLSSGKDGNLKGEWISFWGLSDLKDLKYEGNQLSFVRISRFGGRESTTKFTGTIRRGQLSGTFSSDRGEYKAEGKRLRRMPFVAGNWETKLKVGDREFTANLIVKANEQGKLTADWQSQWGEHEISNVNFKAGKLTFDRKSKIQDRQWESSFDGTIKGHTLSGTIKSERGGITVEGKRAGATIIGQWELEITSDSGSRKQLLRVNPDLSAMLGPISIKKVNLDGNNIAFKTTLEFGDQTFDIGFTGRIKARKLSGEITTSRGASKVTGERRRRTAAKPNTTRLKKTPRRPDILYVPTPQDVVDKMLELAQVTKDDLVYDLGCGDGRIVVTAAKKYGCKAIGYDIARKRVRESRANVEKNNVGHLVRIEQEDVFTLDLSKASIITLYLLPELNVKLIPQLEKLKPGSRIVSHDFDMKGVKPDKVIQVHSSDGDWDEHTVYLWTTPLKKEEAE